MTNEIPSSPPSSWSWPSPWSSAPSLRLDRRPACGSGGVGCDLVAPPRLSEDAAAFGSACRPPLPSASGAPSCVFPGLPGPCRIPSEHVRRIRPGAGRRAGRPLFRAFAEVSPTCPAACRCRS
jgi:hypothetical protein